MPFPEFDRVWSFTSSGSGARMDGTAVREWTFHITWAVGSTGTVEIQTAATVDSTALNTVIGSSQVVTSSLGTHTVVQFSGPFGAVWPRVATMTGGSSGTISVRGIGN